MNAAIVKLTDILHKSRPIPAVRVSTARAKGRARNFSYWDAVRYEIRLDRHGRPTNVALERARSSRRSHRLALRDAAELASTERRVLCHTIGRLDEAAAEAVLRQWSLWHGNLVALEAANQLRAIPHWTDRCLDKSGLKVTFLLAVPALTAGELAAVEATQLRIHQKRERRAAHARSLLVPVARQIRFRKRGINLIATVTPRWDGRFRVTYCVDDRQPISFVHRTWRTAIRWWLQHQPKRIGSYQIYRTGRQWTVRHSIDPHRGRNIPRNRRQLAQLIREDRRIYHEVLRAQPDPYAPDTLGWRVWVWDAKKKRLCSPAQGTIWHTPELRVKRWNASEAVRGIAGIHAARMPRDWRRAKLEHHGELATYRGDEHTIVGVVERFGKYVLGTEGWRAEIAIIRKLRAPNIEIGLALEKAYPDVEVYYEDR